MLFWPQFVVFSRRALDLSPADCAILLTKLAESRYGDLLSVNDVRVMIGGTLARAAGVLQHLEQAGVCTEVEFCCQECGTPICRSHNSLSISDRCQNCGLTVDRWFSRTHILQIGRQPHEYRELLIEQAYQLDAQSLASHWQSTGSIAYVTVDLVGSEIAQNADPEAYNDLIRTINGRLWPAALGQFSGEYLVLGEIGDELKLAFKRVHHAYSAVQQFRRLLINNFARINDHEWFSDGTGGHPRFSCAIGRATLPRDCRATKLLTRTLDRTWDINADSVTRLYRLAHEFASPKNIEVRQKPWRVSIMLTADALAQLSSVNDLGGAPFIPHAVRAGKHKDAQVEDKIAVTLFFDDHFEPLGKDQLRASA